MSEKFPASDELVLYLDFINLFLLILRASHR